MRKISLFLMLMVSSVVFYACNSTGENGAVNPTNTLVTSPKVLTEVISLESEINSFLSSFYSGESFEIGRQIETYDENDATYLVSEVLVGTAKVTRGYMVTDLSNGTPLYFVDVDRTNFVMTAVDIVAYETTTINNINRHEDYVITDEFDLIDVTQDMNYTWKRTKDRDRRRFWGWGSIDSITFSGPDGRCRVAYTPVKYVLGMRVKWKNRDERDCVDGD